MLRLLFVLFPKIKGIIVQAEAWVSVSMKHIKGFGFVFTVTFDLRVPPEQLPALPTRPAPESWFARTLSGDLQEARREEEE